jgi:hypothetical protein
MVHQRQLDPTDQLILYLVRSLTEGSPDLLLEGGGVLTTMLAKLLFLLDVWSMEAFGFQATDFRYIRYMYGPYPLTQFEERLENLKNSGLRPVSGVSLEGKLYRIYRLDLDPKVRISLEPKNKLLADEVMTTFATQKLEEVLEHVYSLEVVRKTRFGEPIDLELLKPTDDALTQALRIFRHDLDTPLSAEHSEVVEQAEKESSNENIEMARLMIEKQRRAFRFKEGS